MLKKGGIISMQGQGRIQGFPKGGVETRNTECGGERGGAVRFRPDTKSGRCCPLQARYKKRGEGVLSASDPI